jgi:hypothetical protein
MDPASPTKLLDSNICNVDTLCVCVEEEEEEEEGEEDMCIS